MSIPKSSRLLQLTTLQLLICFLFVTTPSSYAFNNVGGGGGGSFRIRIINTSYNSATRSRRFMLQQQQHSKITNHHHHAVRSGALVLNSSKLNDDDDDDDDDIGDIEVGANNNNKLKEDAVVLNPSPLESSSSSSSSSRSSMQLDPLFTAVTKMDPQTQRAERITIPIWGELILDRSLFVLVPITLFALGGILLSLYILINSSDTFVNAIVDTAMKQSIPLPSESSSSSSLTDSSDSCRGLCSSQAQDLEGLRSYMNRIGGK